MIIYIIKFLQKFVFQDRCLSHQLHIKKRKKTLNNPKDLIYCVPGTTTYYNIQTDTQIVGTKHESLKLFNHTNTP